MRLDMDLAHLRCHPMPFRFLGRTEACEFVHKPLFTRHITPSR
jgi:hypothetical protein